jgi:hypothetical protein
MRTKRVYKIDTVVIRKYMSMIKITCACKIYGRDRFNQPFIMSATESDVFNNEYQLFKDAFLKYLR